MPYQVIEEISISNDVVFEEEADFIDYLNGYRSDEEQADRVEQIIIDLNLDEALRSDYLNFVRGFSTNPDVTFEGFSPADKKITRTTIWPSEELYNYNEAIKNHLNSLKDVPSRGTVVISTSTV